jgi:D-beta-D-heptose 7-phosphate kinase/D-beta-D-heptose 1-phosphate adenosyltransferase
MVRIATQTRRVYDVAGAGDTVAAVLGLAMAGGRSIEESARIANVAAGIVVGKVGTATVTPEELSSAIPDAEASHA